MQTPIVGTLSPDRMRPARVNLCCFSGQSDVSQPFSSSKSTPQFPPYQAIAVEHRRIVLAPDVQVARVGCARGPRPARVFPLGFRWQREHETLEPGIQALDELLAIVPAHLLDGPVRRPELCSGYPPSPLPRAPACTASRTSRSPGRSSPRAAGPRRHAARLALGRAHQEPPGGDPAEALADIVPEAEFRPQTVSVAADGDAQAGRLTVRRVNWSRSETMRTGTIAGNAAWSSSRPARSSHRVPLAGSSSPRGSAPRSD